MDDGQGKINVKIGEMCKKKTTLQYRRINDMVPIYCGSQANTRTSAQRHFFIHCRLFLMFTSRTTRQYREMTRQRIGSFYCKHAAELWQASLMCVLIDDPHSESFGYQLGNDAYTANRVRVYPSKKKKNHPSLSGCTT